MVNNEIFDLLKIGLTEGEAKVYLALSELGSSTVGPIVKKSKVAYSNIYDILNRLIDKGIVSFIIKNKTKYFQAAPPANLINFLDKKEEEIINQRLSLKKIIPELERLQEIKPGQEAEVFLGVKGLRSAYEKLTKDLIKTDEILFFNIYEEDYSEQSDLFYNSIVDISSKFKNRGIANKDYNKRSWFAKKAKFLNIKFIDFPIPGNIDIVQDKVMIITWSPTPTAILIHSRTVAENFRDYFNKVWKLARK